MAYTSRYGADHGGGYSNFSEVDTLNQGHYALVGDVYGCRQTLDGGNRWFGSNQGMSQSFQVGRAIGFSKRPTTSGTVFWGFGGLHASDGGGYFGYSDMGGYQQHILDSGNGFGNAGYGGGGAGSTTSGNAVRPNYEGIICDYNSGNDTEYIYTLTATGLQRYTNAGANAAATSGATKLLTAAQMGGASYWVGFCMFDSNHIVAVRYDFSYTAALRPSVVYMITSSAASLRVATAGQVSINALTLPGGVGRGHVYHIKKGLDGHFYAACGYDGAFEVALSGSNLTWTDTGVTNDILVSSVDAASDRTLWIGQTGGATNKTDYSNVSNGTPSGHGVMKGAWGGSSWTFSFPANSGNTHGSVYQPGDTTLSTGDLWYLWGNGPDLLDGAYDAAIVRVDPFDDSKILLTGRSGQWQSRDNGAHWYPAMRGLNGGEIDAIRTTGPRSASAGNLTTSGNFDWDEVHTTDQWHSCVRKINGVVAAGNGKVFGSSGPQTWVGDDGKSYTYTESTGAGGSSIKQGSIEIGDAHFRGAAVHAQGGATASDGTVMIALFGGTLVLDPNTTAPSLPVLNSFTPTTQAVGSTVALTGTNFTGATNVTINGTAASFTVNSATSITVTVPTGATTGPIIVVTSAGVSTSPPSTATPLTVSGSSGGGVPTIGASGLSPTSCAPGDNVVITGTNYTGVTAVKVATTSMASFTVDSTTQITARTPSTPVTGKVTVTAAGGTSAASSQTLTVASTVSVPTITSFSPGTASIGDSIAVVGTHFDVANSVKANGTSASFSQVGGTAITFSVPTGATTGHISVASAGGTATSSGTLTVNSVGGGADPFVRRLDQQAPVGAGTAITLTIPTGGVPVGHNVVLIAGSNNVAVSTVVDSRSNVYQNDASVLPGTATAAGMWSAPVTTALQAADTITITYASSVSGRSAVAAEYQYFASSSYNDTAYTSSASGTAFTFTSDVRTPGTATVQANEVIISGLVVGGSGASSGAITSGNSFTKRGSIENASGTQRNTALADRTLTATGTPAVNWTWAVASGFSEVTTAYKINPPGGGGGTGVAPTIAQDTRISALQTATTRTFPAWPNPTLAGSRIVVIVGIADAGNAGIGVSVSGGGTYQQTAQSPAIRTVSGIPQESLREFHLLNANASMPSPVLTFTGLPGAGVNIWAIALEVAGSDPTIIEDTSDTDAQAKITGSGQSITLGPVGPTANDGVLWLAAFHSASINAVRLASGSSFTEYTFANQASPASAAKWAYMLARKSQTLAASAESASATIAGGVNQNYAALMVAIPAGTGTGGGGGGGGGGSGGVTLPDTNDGRGHFARSGHYYPAITSGNSRTALQNALWISARNDIVITNADENNSGLITGDKYSGFAPQMRASNPDIVLSIYGKGPEINEGANFFPNAYYSHQTPWPTGAKIASGFSASILRANPFSSDQPNFADPRGFTATSFRDYRAKDAQSIITDYNTRDGTGTINSWFFDSCGAAAYSSLMADPLHPSQTYQAAYPDGRTVYLDLVDTMIDSAVTLLGDGYLVIANGLGSGPGYYNNLSRLLSHAHIGWAESWIHKNYTTPANAYQIETDWRLSIDMLVHANEVIGKGVMVTTNIANDTAGSAPAGWVAWTTAQTDQLRRFAFASYMLGKRSQSWFEFVPTAPTGDYVEDDPYYHVDLGAPIDNPPVGAAGTGAAIAMKRGNIYQRLYQFGTVYVNPTTATVSFTLDQDYNTVASDGSNSGVSYGAAGATMTLPAHDAVIVYVDNTAPTNSSAPVGTIIAPIGTVATPNVNFVVRYTDPDGDGIASAQARNFTAGTAWSAMIPQGSNWSIPFTLSAGANVLQTRATDNNASPMTSSPLAGTVTYTAGTTPAPVNSVAPSIPADLTVGVTFTIDPGTWSNTPSVFTYTLKSHPATGGTFTTVQTSTLPHYTPLITDAGSVFRASVTAANSVATGSSVDSNTSNPVPLPPDVTLVVSEE